MERNRLRLFVSSGRELPPGVFASSQPLEQKEAMVDAAQWGNPAVDPWARPHVWIMVDDRLDWAGPDGVWLPPEAILDSGDRALMPPSDGAALPEVVQWCSCGCADCGDTVVTLQRIGETIVWHDVRVGGDWRSVAGPFMFDAAEYEAEIRRAEADLD
jgi:hypothetical protein